MFIRPKHKCRIGSTSHPANFRRKYATAYYKIDEVAERDGEGLFVLCLGRK